MSSTQATKRRKNTKIPYCENRFLVRISQFLCLAFKSQSELRLALEIHTSAMIGSVRTSRPVSRDRHTLQPNCCNSYTLEEFRQLNFIPQSGNIPTCHTGRLAGTEIAVSPRASTRGDDSLLPQFASGRNVTNGFALHFRKTINFVLRYLQ